MLRLRLVHSCSEDWGAMRASQGGRHCAVCDKKVLDWTRATEEEARDRLAAIDGKPSCVRMNLDARGRPIFAAAMAAALATAACGGATAQGGTPAPFLPEVALQASPGAASTTPSTPPPSANDDGDGIPNDVDACPKSPGHSDTDPNQNGCPYLGVIVQDVIQVRQHVGFPRGRAVASGPDNERVITAVVEVLKEHPEIDQLEVEGHASLDEPSPQALSEARAHSTLARLVAAGADARRLVATGYGTTRPLADSNTAENRAMNRSVWFQIKSAH